MNRDLITRRFNKYIANRYGISIVHFAQYDNNLLTEITNLRVQADYYFENCIFWHKSQSIHASIFRCKSIPYELSLSIEQIQSVANDVLLQLHELGSLVLYPSRIMLGEDGVVRVYFEQILSNYDFPAINDFYSSLGLDYFFCTRPWIAIATIKDSIEEISYNKINSFFSTLPLQSPISFCQLSAVYYADVLFEKIIWSTTVNYNKI